MELLTQRDRTTVITSLELVKQINIFRAIEKQKSPNDRLFADVEHKTLLETIRQEFEEEIGKQEVMLSSYKSLQNKDMPMFELTSDQAIQMLTRESKVVRKAVIQYLRHLEKQIVKPKMQTEIELIIASALVLQKHDARLSLLESKFTQLEENRQSAIDTLNHIERSDEEVPVVGRRLLINQMVRSYSEKTGIPHRAIWNSMYSKMLYAYHFNVNGYKKLHDKESKLDIVDRNNQMDNLFTLVSKELA